MNSLSTNHQNLAGHLSPVQVRLALSPRFTTTSPSSPSSNTPTSNANRRIAIAVDMSEESGYAVKWAIQNYLRPGDAVILLHVRPTSILYGADWGSNTPNNNTTTTRGGGGEEEEEQVLEEDFDNLTNTKAVKLSEPLTEAEIPFKIHIVKDHDLKERLCLEVERLGLSAVIMGSRGFGASDKRKSKGRLGRVSDYCVRHCVCPVVVVRYPDQGNNNDDGELHPVTEEDQEYHDAEGQIQNGTYQFHLK